MKIRYVVDELRKKFRAALSPYKNLVIDDSLLLFKGRLRGYLPSIRDEIDSKIGLRHGPQKNKTTSGYRL